PRIYFSVGWSNVKYMPILQVKLVVEVMVNGQVDGNKAWKNEGSAWKNSLKK
ncbi:hypothetical protein KI387_012705, partial [Taxus chinensis]